METNQTANREMDIQLTENIVKHNGIGMFTTSMILAEAFEKEHKNVLRDIENLECSQAFRQLNFEHTPYVHPQNGQTYPMFQITRDGFAFLAMGFTGKKAAAWKEKFLEAFNVMEAQMLARKGEEPTSIPQDEERILPEKTPSYFFRSRKKMGKDDLAALSGFLRMEALIQEDTWENAAKRLCQRMHTETIAELPKYKFNEAIVHIFESLFLVKKGNLHKTTISTEELRHTLNGMILFWRKLSDYKDAEIRTYIFNRCGVESLDELKTDRDLFKAILAVWSGLSNHSLQWKCW